MKKVISLQQPWASLVVMGSKQYETRSWKTFHRGKLLIHASQKQNSIMEDTRNIELNTNNFKIFVPDVLELPFGAIIGEVELVECLPSGKPGAGAGNLKTLTYTKRPSRAKAPCLSGNIMAA